MVVRQALWSESHGEAVVALRALLVGDRRFVEVEGAIYTEGPKGAETGERYLEWFDTITVAGRRGYVAEFRPERLNRVHATGLNVAFLPDISGVRRRLRNRARARRELLFLFRQTDCVIARLPTELGLEAAALALDTGLPLALDVGGCVLDGLRTHGSLAGRIYAPIAYVRMRSVLRQAKWAAYVTRDFLQERYPAAEGAHTVACSNVDIPEAPVELLDGRLGRLATDEGRVLTFGTISSLYGRFKGVQHALAALERAAPRLPSFRFRILGGGDQAPWRELAARHGLANNVIFDGTLPEGEPVRQWLDGIDIYLQPSLREGLPRALIEAMSRACPAVASNVAGIPELLPPEVLHKPGDVARLAALIEQSAAPGERAMRARQNWTRAQGFLRHRLADIRGAFWGGFRDSVRAQSCP